MKKVGLLLLLLWLMNNASAQYRRAAFPLHVAEGGRHLVDRNNVPFFYNAETPWVLTTNLSVQDASAFLNLRAQQGFNAIQVQLLPFAPASKPNVNGDVPFAADDFTQPNEAFFDHAVKVLQQAEAKGMLVVLNPAWLDCCNTGWETVIRKNSPEQCRAYGRYLAQKFRSFPNLIWLHGGDKDPLGLIDHFRQMALGVKDVLPHAVQTFHASSGHSSTDVIPYFSNTWLNFSFTYTYFGGKRVWMTIAGFGRMPEVYEVNHLEYAKRPVRPFVLGESQYEGERTIGSAIAGPALMRRQMYWSVLSGSCGAAYGSWNWPVSPQWPKISADSGAWQMGIARRFFESFNWHQLVPDIEGRIVTEGGGRYTDTNYVTAAYTSDNSCVMVYLPPSNAARRTIVLAATFVDSLPYARWFNPVRGTYTSAKMDGPQSKAGLRFTTPGNNSSEQDWVLILQRSKPS